MASFSTSMTTISKKLVLWAIILILFIEFFTDGMKALLANRYDASYSLGYYSLLALSVGFTKVLSASGLLVTRLRVAAILLIVCLALLGLYWNVVEHDVIGTFINIMNIGLAAIAYWYSSEQLHASR